MSDPYLTSSLANVPVDAAEECSRLASSALMREVRTGVPLAMSHTSTSTGLRQSDPCRAEMLDDCSTAADDAHEEQHQRNHEQHVDEGAHGVRPNYASSHAINRMTASVSSISSSCA